jgi:hypothetical protein
MGKLTPVKKEAVKPVGSLFAPSSEQDLTQTIIVLHGQFGAGKSTTAASVSKYFPDPLPTKKESKVKYDLKDVLWISFDRGGTHGFRERGINVPVFDIHKFRSDRELWKSAGYAQQPNIFQAAEKAAKEAAKLVEAGEVKWVVVDTVSSMDSELVTYYEQHAPQGRGGTTDTWAVYRSLLQAHKLFHDQITLLPCGIIFCCHSMSAGDDSQLTPDQKAKKLSLTMPGMPGIIPAITGKGAGVYKAHADVQLYIHASPKIGAKGQLERWAYPVKSDQGGEAKNRFELSLEPKEEPNLRKILGKITG